MAPDRPLPRSERDLGAFLLREILRCGLCHLAMKPALWRTRRVYRCAGTCGRGNGRLVDALLLEYEVWDRLTRHRPAFAHRAIPPEARRGVLEKLVRQIVVTSYPIRLRLNLKPPGRSSACQGEIRG